MRKLMTNIIKTVILVVAGITTVIAQPTLGSTRFEQGGEKDFFTTESNPEALCLAMNIYHEARGDNLAGKYAVADVVINRMHDDRYPDNICDVIYEGRQYANGQMIRNQCQFSWYCDGKKDTPTNRDSWRESQEIAYKILVLGDFRGITEGATHYHATYVDPTWNRRMQHIGRIGEHLFFRAP